MIHLISDIKLNHFSVILISTVFVSVDSLSQFFLRKYEALSGVSHVLSKLYRELHRYRKRNARANRDTCKCLFLFFACFSRFLISEDFRSFRFGAREYFFCVKVRAARLISRKERLHRQTPVPIIVFKNTTHRDIFFNSYVKFTFNRKVRVRESLVSRISIRKRLQFRGSRSILFRVCQ